VIGEGLYECGSCGHRWNPAEGVADLDAALCELCGEIDVFVTAVRDGYRRGVAQAAERDRQSWAAAVEARREQAAAQAARERAEARRLAAERKGERYRWEREQEEQDGMEGLLPRRVRARLNRGYWDAWRKERGLD
jgi:hypothetical protein